MLHPSFAVNGQGHLTIGGADTITLAETYQTPLCVMDEGAIRTACRAFFQSVERFYGGQGLVAFASKAFCCKEIYRIVMEEGLGADVVSGGELYTAMEAGFPPEKLFFHGNNKTEEELAYALECKVGYIVVDNLPELARLHVLAKEKGAHQKILLRIKPGVDAHTHDFVKTGQIDSKFGFALETGEALEAATRALACGDALELSGLHCHIGSQIFDVEPFCHTAQVMAGLLCDIRDKTGHQLPILNLGGGFGIAYTEDNDPAPFESYMQAVSTALKESCQSRGLSVPFVVLEPGRSIVGNGALTLYTVGSRKEIPNIRTYVAVDGGMTDNPRYALYHSCYEAVIANRANLPRSETVTIAGRCCESGDLLGEDMPLQACQTGDILAVLQTGAYNYSMASNYNRVPRPAVVLVKDGAHRLIVRRETFADLCRNDL